MYHGSIAVEAASDLPFLVRDGRRIFPLWRTDLRDEVRQLDLWWVSGGIDDVMRMVTMLKMPMAIHLVSRQTFVMKFRILLWGDKNLRFREIQGGITCGAINEPRKSSKAIDERFHDKNGVFMLLCFIDLYIFMYTYYIIYVIYFYTCIFYSFHSFSVLFIAFLLYRKLFCSIHSFSVL